MFELKRRPQSEVSGLMRHDHTRVGAVAAVAVMVSMLMVGSAHDGTTAGASFTARAEVDAGAVSTTDIAPLTGIEATRSAHGTASVSWTAADGQTDDLIYDVQRTIGDQTQEIDVDVDGAKFNDDVTQPMSLIGEVTDFDTGYGHACAIAEGKAFCWGQNHKGQLGTGTRVASSVPVAVDMSDVSGEFISISVGSAHTCAIASEGEYELNKIYCWGSNSSGQLGLGYLYDDEYTPEPVKTLGALLWQNPIKITSGTSHSCTLASGRVYCWGNGVDGQLGDGKQIGEGGFGSYSVPEPTAVIGAVVGRNITYINAGSYGSCAIDDEGIAYCWGNNGWGQVGNGTMRTDLSTAVRVKNLINVTSIQPAAQHACAVSGGRQYCWGRTAAYLINRESELHSDPNPAPIDNFIPGTSVFLGNTTIATGDYGTCTTNPRGAVYCWGDKGYLTGIDSTEPVPSPQRVGATENYTNISKIAMGNTHACGLSDGALTCWGMSAVGSLGSGNEINPHPLPVYVEGTSRECIHGWIAVDEQLCTPGPSIPVSYTIKHTIRGWSPPEPLEISADWVGTP